MIFIIGNSLCSFLPKVHIKGEWDCWHLEILRSWYSESWNPGILKSWNPEILNSWNPEILKSWNPKILKSWNLEILKSWNLEILKSWDPEILKSWIPKKISVSNCFRISGFQDPRIDSGFQDFRILKSCQDFKISRLKVVNKGAARPGAVIFSLKFTVCSLTYLLKPSWVDFW